MSVAKSVPVHAWTAMVMVLAGEPAPQLPRMKGRKYRARLPGDDDPRQRLITDAEAWRALAREVCPLA